jgi:predicted RNase H-like HicB family nuclease
LRIILFWRRSPVHKYAIEIFYSDGDNGYIAVVPELAGCSAFGESEEQALQEIKTAIELWLSTARKLGREIPKPRGQGALRDLLDDRLRTDATSCE